jgi:hypothetical protein
MKHSENKSSISMSLGQSVESSWRSKKESTLEIIREATPNHVPPEILQAQILLAKIAVKIQTEERRKADEKQ